MYASVGVRSSGSTPPSRLFQPLILVAILIFLTYLFVFQHLIMLFCHLYFSFHHNHEWTQNNKPAEVRSVITAKMDEISKDIETKLTAAEQNREKEIQKKLDFVKKEVCVHPADHGHDTTTRPARRGHDLDLSISPFFYLSHILSSTEESPRGRGLPLQQVTHECFTTCSQERRAELVRQNKSARAESEAPTSG